MKCSICNKTITMYQWLNKENMVDMTLKGHIEHDGSVKDRYAHKECFYNENGVFDDKG